MTSYNKYIFLKYFNMACIITILFSISSCELEDSVDDNFQFADLEVYVSGTLSGNPRSGLKVAIYETKDDAINEVNMLTSLQFTDTYGFAFFGNLDPGFRYWVRVNTTLIHNINRSQVITTGYNEMSMTIL